MKRQIFLIAFVLMFAAEIVALTVFALKTPDFSLDTVTVNEVAHSVAKDFYSMADHKNVSSLDYAVLDVGGNVIYATREGLSQSINEAVAHRDTIIDVTIDGSVAGKLIIYNDGVQTLQAQKQTAVIVLSAAVAFQGIICAVYAVYLYRTVEGPFRKLKGFAERIAGGNLDIPLEMDRRNLFGAFTESFDIMQSELKKAKAAEAKAQQSKKELVAKLSHDIKTPVASIKAVSEVGLAVAASKKDRGNYSQIIAKADQITALITNLFTATLEELQQLSVSPVNAESKRIKTLLENADYLRRAKISAPPQCLVYADILRLQQVFDNIFANSYKYADTPVDVSYSVNDGRLNIVIEDGGGGVPHEELAVLKEKFKRGSNSAGIDGAGLGLYISDYFMEEMRGGLTVENGGKGLKITVAVTLSSNI